MTKYDFVITDLSQEQRQKVEEALITLIQKGVITTAQIHFREKDS